MDIPVQPRASENLQKILANLQGVEFRRPEEFAEFLTKEDARFSADDLIAFGYILSTRIHRSEGRFYVPEWLARVFASLTEGFSPKIICDPWAGIGFLAAVLQEATGASEVIAITQNSGEHTLGKVLVPQAAWQIGDPLRLLGETNKELDLVASILPMGGLAHHPLKLTLPSGEAVELADDLGNLLLVASSMRLSSSGVGLFVVTPSFFFSPRTVFHRFSDLGLGIEAALALPSGTFAPYTNIPAYLVIVRRKPLTRMFVAQLSADANTNLQIISNFRQEREGGSLELGRFVAPEYFRSIEHLRAAETFTLAERRLDSALRQ